MPEGPVAYAQRQTVDVLQKFGNPRRKEMHKRKRNAAKSTQAS
jgi:hypothetical protein